MERNRLRMEAQNNQIQVATLFETDEDLVIMRKKFTKEFYDQFNKGFKHYISGDWQAARELLETIEDIKGSIDYPTQCLITYIKDLNYEAPSEWKGYRVLTEK